MPITFSKIANNSSKVTFQYGEDEITIEYYPSRITEKTLAQMQEIYSMNDGVEDIMHGFQALNELFAGKPLIDADVPKVIGYEHLKDKVGLMETLGILKSWDVLEDDEKTMFPISADRLSALPIAFRLAVLKAVMGDIRPNEMAPATS